MGSVLLGLSLNLEPGDNLFYIGSLALSATWLVGGLASGPISLGDRPLRPNAMRAVGVAVLAVVIFSVGALICIQVPLGRDALDGLLERAQAGWLPIVAAITLVTGMCEEVFFRGALWAAFAGHRPLLWTTVIYTLTTIATLNAMLVLAAAILGLLVGLARQLSGGVLAPMLIHAVWGLSMLLLLPWIISLV